MHLQVLINHPAVSSGFVIAVFRNIYCLVANFLLWNTVLVSIWMEQMCRYSFQLSRSKPCCYWMEPLHTWWAGNDFLLTNKPYLQTVFKHCTDVLTLIKQSTHLIRCLAFWLILSTLQCDGSWNAYIKVHCQASWVMHKESIHTLLKFNYYRRCVAYSDFRFCGVLVAMAWT